MTDNHESARWAADRALQTLQAKYMALEEERDVLHRALRSIALSSCCDGCMEAKRMAMAAYRELHRTLGELNEEALRDE